MRSTRGFTLTELMLGFFLLSVAGLALIGLFVAGTEHYRRLDTATTVSTLASQKLESLMTEELASVVSDSGSFAAPFSDYSYDLTVTDGPGGVKDIELVVTGPEDLNRELRAYRAPPQMDPGMAAFIKYDCWSCHDVSGLPTDYAGSVTGPSLSSPGINWTAQDRMNSDPALESQVQAATGGTEPKDYMRFSVRNPGDYYVTSYDPSSIGGQEMPEFTPDVLPPAELEQITNWLSQFDSPPP